MTSTAHFFGLINHNSFDALRRPLNQCLLRPGEVLKVTKEEMFLISSLTIITSQHRSRSLTHCIETIPTMVSLNNPLSTSTSIFWRGYSGI
jgi:hypothetical protein